MAGGKDSMGELPMVKCSDCGVNVDILAMGDHVCAKPANDTSRTSSPPPPAPPPKSGLRRPTSRSDDVLQIDPLRANRPFLHPTPGQDGNDSLVPSPLSTSPGSRSPLRTSPLPQPPTSASSGEGIPSFPLPRSMSGRQVNGMALKKDAISAPAAPSPGYADAMNQDIDCPPHSAHLPFDSQEPPPPPPLPKDDVPHGHQHNASIVSQSSYRTSIASTRYGDRYSKRSTAMTHRSFGSLAIAGYRYEEDIPPIPQSPPNPFHHSVFSDSSMSDMSKRNTKNEIHSGFDFGASHFKGDLEKPTASPLRLSANANSDRHSSSRVSSSRGSAELFFNSPSQSAYGPPVDLPDESDLRRSASPAGSGKVEYKAFKPSESDYLQPNLPEQNERGELERKKPDASSSSAISMSNFARALGLDNFDDNVEDSTASSAESSPSETRSGTSLSSIQSDISHASRGKPSDLPRLGCVVEDPRKETQQSDRVLDDSHPSESPTILEPPPRMPESLFSPDSPTDPTLGKGGLSLIPEVPHDSENKEDEQEELRRLARAATEPSPRSQQGKPRGECRGCGEMIYGKSISSADGRLTGRYHRGCFTCFTCRLPFETNDFYVLQDRPYCAQHYHERNGSICAGCHNGIEGEYLATNERAGPGPANYQKFHIDCLRCRTCNSDLRGEYFEWNGLVYCERDARRAAASVSPHRFRRPTMPSSPLAPPGIPMPPPGRGRPPPPGYRGRGGRGPRSPPGSYDNYGPPPGPGRGYPGRPPPSSNQLGPPPAGGPRRFPERRTTKLMMI
ncbi:LIM domain-containing protein [Aspergillus undulatus]|uniref:LIM domain-containing protein n=1 Tax=Aspergillus undulatus TaxID=1810928 RepID=UPI003CCCE636